MDTSSKFNHEVYTISTDNTINNIDDVEKTNAGNIGAIQRLISLRRDKNNRSTHVDYPKSDTELEDYRALKICFNAMYAFNGVRKPRG